ncbi:MAG: hypothetical protein ACOCO5_10115 [Segatella copri]|jgi:hypothetical protein
MKFVTNIVETMIVYVAAGAACIIGMQAGTKLFDEKIGPAMDKKLHKKH